MNIFVFFFLLLSDAEASLQMYEHITDEAQRAVLKKLLAANGQAVKRQDISASVPGFSGKP